MVIIVGTSHSIQTATDDADQKTGERLKAFLENLGRTHKIRAVAEEMSVEALAEKKRSTSIPKEAARSLKVAHQFCDPDRTQRKELGIFQPNEIKLELFLSTLSEDEKSSLLASRTR